MKKLIPLFVLLLFVGCSPKYPLNANLNLKILPQSAGLYSSGTSLFIRGKDSREEADVVVYQLTEGASVRITNQNPPQILLSERLAGGFREQGLLMESAAPISLEVDIQELLAKVTRPELLYLSQATTIVQMTVMNRGRKFTKTYNLESNREALTRPKVEDLEELLNNQLSDIVEQILDDTTIREFIKKE